MNARTLVFEIAKWEFHRWFKWKDQILTLFITAAISAAIWGGIKFLKDDQAPIELAVLGSDLLKIDTPPNSRLILQAADGQEEMRLRTQVGRGELAGLLVIKNSDEAELLVYKEPLWRGELEERLREARTQLKIQQLRIPPAQLAEAMRPLTLAVVIHEGGHMPASTAEKITAGLAIGIMLFGIFIGAAYQFVAITGEKQLRVTEMIVSAVSPQQWIDGKILGVSAYALAFTATTVSSVLLFVFISQAFGSGWMIPIEVTNPMVVIALILVALAGFMFWNTIFAAISATINDPNTSARGSLLLLPFAPVVFAAFAFKNPDTVVMKTLSVIPFTSSAVLPARLVLTEVSWWEVPLALLLLALCTWFFRSAGGKIFRLGMLMHGKEPSFKEMMRWARET
jgi:ABC-2 type transport system permease protein